MSDLASGPVDDPVNDPASEAATDVMVQVRGLTMRYGRLLVLRDVSFDIRRGEILVLMGGSGCGKSTLLRHLIGLNVPASGRVTYRDDDGRARDLFDGDESTQAVLRRRFGVMFQAGALFSSMTVGENVALPLQEFTDLAPDAIDDIVRYKLALVGLDGTAGLEPSALSGGMRKRAAIARAMVLDPPLLFLDEPSAGLDPVSSARLDELILHLRASLGTTVVMVTHELASIDAVADRAVYLDATSKTMTALGPPATLRAQGPAAVREFLRRGRTLDTAEPS